VDLQVHTFVNIGLKGKVSGFTVRFYTELIASVHIIFGNSDMNMAQTFVEFLNSQDSYTEEDYKKDSDELEKDLEEEKDLEQEDFSESGFKV